MPKATLMIVIRQVSNRNNIVPSENQLQSLYTDVMHLEELIDFIDKNRGPKETFILTSLFKCCLEHDELDEEYIGLYSNGQMIMDPIYGQISYNCCVSNALKLKFAHNPKIFYGRYEASYKEADCGAHD